jgi:D-arabinose 1-dehydrogenase-like Zn-dependent alcohol dehydrogenase
MKINEFIFTIKFDTFVFKLKTLTMATVILDTRSTEAKKMLEFLRATRYARVIEEDIPNDETISAIKDVEKGKVKSYESAKDMMSTLKKKAGV